MFLAEIRLFLADILFQIRRIGRAVCVINFLIIFMVNFSARIFRANICVARKIKLILFGRVFLQGTMLWQPSRYKHYMKRKPEGNSVDKQMCIFFITFLFALSKSSIWNIYIFVYLCFKPEGPTQFFFILWSSYWFICFQIVIM